MDCGVITNEKGITSLRELSMPELTDQLIVLLHGEKYCARRIEELPRMLRATKRLFSRDRLMVEAEILEMTLQYQWEYQDPRVAEVKW